MNDVFFALRDSHLTVMTGTLQVAVITGVHGEREDKDCGGCPVVRGFWATLAETPASGRPGIFSLGYILTSSGDLKKRKRDAGPSQTN